MFTAAGSSPPSQRRTGETSERTACHPGARAHPPVRAQTWKQNNTRWKQPNAPHNVICAAPPVAKRSSTCMGRKLSLGKLRKTFHDALLFFQVSCDAGELQATLLYSELCEGILGGISTPPPPKTAEIFYQRAPALKIVREKCDFWRPEQTNKTEKKGKKGRYSENNSNNNKYWLVVNC